MPGTSNNIEAIAKALIEATKRAGETRGLYGAEVGAIIRRVCPDFKPFDFEVGSVREFIEKHVTDLRAVGRSGSDIIYGLRGWAPPPIRRQMQDREAESEVAGLWRIWVSPASPLSIAIRRDGTSLRSIPTSNEQQEGEVKVQSATPDLHRELARRFLSERAEQLGDASSTLSRILEDRTSRWWMSWTQAIRRLSLDLNREWIGYRQAGLEAALKEQLTSKGLVEEEAERALKTIRTARDLWHKNKVEARTVVSSSSPPAEHLPLRVDAVSLLRDVTVRMSEHELRSTVFLLGLALDAIIDRQRR